MGSVTEFGVVCATSSGLQPPNTIFISVVRSFTSLPFFQGDMSMKRSFSVAPMTFFFSSFSLFSVHEISSTFLHGQKKARISCSFSIVVTLVLFIWKMKIKIVLCKFKRQPNDEICFESARISHWASRNKLSRPITNKINVEWSN